MCDAQLTEFEALWPACGAVFDGGRIDGGDAIGQLAASNGDRGGSCIVDLSTKYVAFH